MAPSWALLLLLVVGCGAKLDELPTQSDAERKAAVDAMYADFEPDFPDVAALSVEEFLALQRDEDVVVVDVREPEERAISIIPGSIAQDEFERRLEEFEDRPIIVQCTIGYRSARYVQSLAKKNVQAYNLKGGILSWVHEGQAVVDPDGTETRQVHVYAPRWNLLPQGYKGVW